MDGVDEITKQSRILYQYAHANILADVDCPEDDDALSVFQYLTEALTRQVMALQRMTPLNETDLNASDSRNSVLSPSPDGDAVAFFDGWLEHVLRRGVATAIARIIKVEDTTPNTKRFPAEVIFAALEFLRICFSGCRGVQTVRVLETCGLCQALLSRVEDVVHAPSSDVKGSTSSLDIDGPSCASAPDDDGEVPSLFDLRQQRLLQITALHLLCGVATRLQTWMIERLLLAYSPHLLNHLAAMLSDASPPSCVEGMEGAPERVEVAQKAMSLLLVLHRRHPRMVRVLRRHVGEMSQRPPPKHYRADLVFALVDVLQWRFGNVDVASGVGEGSASSSRTGWRREHGRLVCDAAQLLLLVLRTSTQIPGISLEHAMVHPELPPCCNPGGDRSWISLRVKREHAPRIRMDDVEPQLLWRWGGPSMLRRYVHVGDGATPSHQRPVASGPQVAAPQLDNKSPCLTSAPIPGGHSSLSGYEEEQVELNELLDAVAAADGLDVLCRIISTNCGESRGELSSSRRLRRAALDVLWIMVAEGSLAHLRWLATCSNLFVGLRATLNNHVRHDHHHALGVSHLSSAASTPPYMATSPHPGWIQATLGHGSATHSHTSAVAEHFLLPPQHHTTTSNTRDLDVNPSSMSTSMWRAEDAGAALHLVRVLYARLRADNAWFRRGEEDSPYRKQGCDVECAESIVGWLAMLHVDEPIEEEDGLLLKCIAVDAVQALASICMCCGVESISSTGTAHGGLWRQPYGQDVPRWSLPRVLCQALLQPRTQDDGVLLQLIRAELRASQGWGANTPPTAITHAIVVLQLYQWCLTSLPSASERSERVVGSWSCEELRRRQLDFLVEDAAGVLPLLVELSAGRAGCITSGAADLQHKALEALRAVLAHVQHGPSSSWLVAGAPPPKCVDVVHGRRTSFIYAVPEPDAWTAPSDTVPLSTSPNTSIENSGLVSHVVADADLASPTCVSDAPSEGADALEMFSLQLDAAVDVVRLSTWLFSLGLEEVLFHVLADVLPFQHRCLCDAMRAAQHNPLGPSLEDLDDRHDPHHQMGHEGADEPHPLPATPPDFRNLWDCMKIVGAWIAMLGQAHTSSLAQEHLRRLWVGGIGFTLCYLVLRCGPCCSASMLWQSEPPYASGGALISEDSEGSISLLSSDDGGFSASLTSMRRRSVHVSADADPLDNLLMSVDGPEEEEEEQVVVLHPVGTNLNEPTQRMLRHMDALFSLSVELVLLAMSAEKLKDAGDAVIAELANTWLGRANLSEVEDSSTVKRVAQHEGAEAAAALLGSVESLEKRIRLCA